MYRILFISCLCLMLAPGTPALAQGQIPVSIHLKNGRVLQGVIISSIFDEYLTLEVDPVTHLDIRYDKSDMITFGDFTPTRPVIFHSPASYVHASDSGFTHSASAGLLMGQYDHGGAALSLSTVNGYRFSSGLQAGLGLGLDFYWEVRSLPVYAQVAADVFKRRVTPYAYLNVGYGFAWANQRPSDFITYDQVRGGWLMQPGLGYRFNWRHTALLLALGYRMQKVTLDYTSQDWNGTLSVHEERRLRRFILTAGISF